MAIDFKNLMIRTVSGAVLVATIIVSILWCNWSFLVVFGLIAVMLSEEFITLINHRDTVFIPVITLSLTSTLPFLALNLRQVAPVVSGVLFALYPLCLIGLFIAELYRRKPNPFADWACIAYTQLYVAMPLMSLNLIVNHNGVRTPWLLLALFIFIWVNDTFAYLTGCTFGKHRLFERISPKKSWEGFVGGNIFTLVAAVVVARFVPQPSLLEWFIFAEIVVVFGTFGDLVESLLKRIMQVKDSGTAIPGHGGWLDRFDSLLFAAPAIAVYLYVLNLI